MRFIFLAFIFISLLFSNEREETLRDSPYKGEIDVEQPIDYENLSVKYYPYIKFYEASSDKQIATLINRIENSKLKDGIFLGVYSGLVVNNATNDPLYQSKTSFGYGAKVGFQSFFPSLYERLSIPSLVGSRLYLQYFSSGAKTLDFASIGFSAIGIGADLMIDLPISKLIESGIVFGPGLVSMIYDKSTDSSLGGVINTGFNVVIDKKHRVELEFKIVINNNLDWFGAMVLGGYSYVF